MSLDIIHQIGVSGPFAAPSAKREPPRFFLPPHELKGALLSSSKLGTSSSISLLLPPHELNGARFCSVSENSPIFLMPIFSNVSSSKKLIISLKSLSLFSFDLSFGHIKCCSPSI